MEEPVFLVRSEEDELHGYWTPRFLLIDLAHNRATPPARIYERVRGMTLRYVPVTEAEIRQRLEAPSVLDMASEAGEKVEVG